MFATESRQDALQQKFAKWINFIHHTSEIHVLPVLYELQSYVKFKPNFWVKLWTSACKRAFKEFSHTKQITRTDNHHQN
jgi:hypothetical protein